MPPSIIVVVPVSSVSLKNRILLAGFLFFLCCVKKSACKILLIALFVEVLKLGGIMAHFAEPSALGRGIKELVDEMKLNSQSPAWLNQVNKNIDQLNKHDNGSGVIMDQVTVPQNIPVSYQAKFEDAIKEIERIKQTNIILETKYNEAMKSENTMRDEKRKLEGELETCRQQIKKISEREIEARVRAEVNEDMVEKLFDKMLEKMH